MSNIDLEDGEKPDMRRAQLDQNGPDVTKVAKQVEKHRHMHHLNEAELENEDLGPRRAKMDMRKAKRDMQTFTRGQNGVNEEKEDTGANQDEKHRHMAIFESKSSKVESGEPCMPKSGMRSGQLGSRARDKGDVDDAQFEQFQRWSGKATLNEKW